VKKTVLGIIDVFERIVGVYIPSTAFVFMFSAFCIQIFSRYFLNHQYEWTYEYTVIGFTWTVVFGALFASKHNEHVSFSLIYDHLGPRGKATVTVFSNLLILVSFVMMFEPIVEYATFIKIKKTAVLGVPYDIIYGPFVLFIAMSGAYLIRDILRAIRVFLKQGNITERPEHATITENQ